MNLFLHNCKTLAGRDKISEQGNVQDVKLETLQENVNKLSDMKMCYAWTRGEIFQTAQKLMSSKKPHGRSNLSSRNQVQEDKNGIGEEWHAYTRAADTRMEKNE